jgi:hypothetical protein
MRLLPRSTLVRLPCHFVQPRDAVLNIGVRREEIVHPGTGERVDDEEVGGSGIALGRRIGHLLGSALNLAQGGSEREGTLASLSADPVRLIFAPAADLHLHKAHGERPQDDEKEATDRPDALVIVAPATE